METYVICPKCTGLLSASDDSVIKIHMNSCSGDLTLSECSQFCVDKTFLLNLLQPEIDDAATQVAELNRENQKINDKKNASAKGGQRKAGQRNTAKRKKKIKTENSDANQKESLQGVSSQGDVTSDETVKQGNELDDTWEDNDMLLDATSVEEVLESIEIAESEKQNGEDITAENKDEGLPGEAVIEVVKVNIRRSKRLPKPKKNKDYEAVDEMKLNGDNEQSEDVNEVMKLEEVEDPSWNASERKETTGDDVKKAIKYKDWKADLHVKYKEYLQDVPDENGKTEEKYSCPKCKTRSFEKSKVGMFGRHFTTCKPAGSDELKCPEEGCDYVAKDAKRFSEHKRFHLLPYMCEFCSRRFADKRNMIAHTMTHTDERPLACTICSYRSRNKRLMKEHMRKHTGNFEQCPEEGCDFYTAYHASLMSHIQLKHRARTRFPCPENDCTYITNNRGSLQKHMLIHTNEKPFKCALCDYKASSKIAVISHTRSHTKEKLYFCDKCNYSASYSSAFKQHMMTHLGMKTWQCGMCGYNSNTRAKVIRHIQSKHPDNDPYTSVVNLGLSMKLDLNQYRRYDGLGITYVTVPANEVQDVKTTNANGMDLVQVENEEIVISEELLTDGEVFVVTEDGQQVLIPAQNTHKNDFQNEQIQFAIADGT